MTAERSGTWLHMVFGFGQTRLLLYHYSFLPSIFFSPPHTIGVFFSFFS